MTWHWFITIPIGDCESDELVLKRLRRIENKLCKGYLINKYWKLPANARYTMAIAFEGERELGTRHAHILAYIPQPIRRRIPQEMAIGLFPSNFRFQWLVQKDPLNSSYSESRRFACRKTYNLEGVQFRPANKARVVYSLKDVRQA